MIGGELLLKGWPDANVMEYFNLFAATEIAQGNHSVIEIILPLTLPLVKTNSVDEEKFCWKMIDYSKIYMDFLSDQFKSTPSYHALRDRYPQFLHDKKNYVLSPKQYLLKLKQEEALTIQRWVRAHRAYDALQAGPLWAKADQIKRVLPTRKLNLNQFQVLSRTNLSHLQQALGTLSQAEINFMRVLMGQSAELTHYTDRFDEIHRSGYLFSTTKFKTIANRSGLFFSTNSGYDIANLANGDFVFFRYELEHQSQFTSRFGEEHIIVNADSTTLFQNGWISMYEMLQPQLIKVVKSLENQGLVLRKMHSGYNSSGTIQYEYAGKVYDFDIYGTLFYGPDIRRGIALTAIRELRRIGGDYQTKHLSELNLPQLNQLLSQLFRIEAKIPSLVALENTHYRYTAPDAMKRAIVMGDLTIVKEIIHRGMDINDQIDIEKSPAFLASEYNEAEILRYLASQGAKLVTDKTTCGHIAIRCRQKEALRVFIELTHAINHQDENGNTMMDIAIATNATEMVEILLTHNPVMRMESLFEAAFFGYSEVLEKLCHDYPEQRQAWLTYHNQNGHTLLDAALASQKYLTFVMLFGQTEQDMEVLQQMIVNRTIDLDKMAAQLNIKAALEVLKESDRLAFLALFGEKIKDLLKNKPPSSSTGLYAPSEEPLSQLLSSLPAEDRLPGLQFCLSHCPPPHDRMIGIILGLLPKKDRKTYLMQNVPLHYLDKAREMAAPRLGRILSLLSIEDCSLFIDWLGQKRLYFLLSQLDFEGEMSMYIDLNIRSPDSKKDFSNKLTLLIQALQPPLAHVTKATLFSHEPEKKQSRHDAQEILQALIAYCKPSHPPEDDKTSTLE